MIEKIGGQIDILKMDCEGYERDIFQGVEAFRKVREIRMEYHFIGGRTLDDLRKTAAGNGFTINHLSVNTNFGIAHLTNSFFVHPAA